MGADVFKETDQGETATDLATRCGGVKEMIQILRAAEGKLHLRETASWLCSIIRKF